MGKQPAENCFHLPCMGNGRIKASVRNHVLCVKNGDNYTAVCANEENSILDALRSAGFAAVEAPCGGRGVCGKCAVRIKGSVRNLDTDEVSFVDGTVSACRNALAGDCELWLVSGEGMNIVSGGRDKIRGGGEGLGLAVDLGTTTVVMALYDLSSGKRIAEKSAENAQRTFGADVISRIEHCRNGNAGALFDCLGNQLSEMAEEFGPLKKVFLVGNTVMEHFAARLDPSPIAVPPFTPQSIFGEHKTIGGTDVYFARCVSAYVGGDVLAGMLACNLQNEEKTVLSVDIGTNGEIVLGNKDGFTCCATAAGPAFEGAEIECGMSAKAGAIDSVRIENGKITAHVIGGGKAKGICGSGLIDAVAAMLELGIIGKSGRFIKGFTELGGKKVFMLADGVYLSVQDIRRLQLAKAAIRAGIDTLLDGNEAREIIVAGGFGNYINSESAVKIGLLPDFGAEKIRQAGNAAAIGAALLLEPDNENVLCQLAEKCRYVDLSSSEEFSENYIKSLNF